jgi:hypothetical protein
LGGVPLCGRYQRLYDLTLNKLCTVSEMRAWWEEGGAAWAWCIHLWTWEEELLVECRGLLPDSRLCVTGCGGVETAKYLFLSCPIFSPYGA